mmetsp:Transcript_12259/g.41088  ORF Transcript_12259/g.41088 Transcript_12259/m.41088 type:complete len:218 (-) Transcript_12259:207-860(-)
MPRPAPLPPLPSSGEAPFRRPREREGEAAGLRAAASRAMSETVYRAVSASFHFENGGSCCWSPTSSAARAPCSKQPTASGSSIAAASSRITKSNVSGSAFALAFSDELAPSSMSRCNRRVTCSAADAVQATSRTSFHTWRRVLPLRSPIVCVCRRTLSCSTFSRFFTSARRASKFFASATAAGSGGGAAAAAAAAARVCGRSRRHGTRRRSTCSGGR